LNPWPAGNLSLLEAVNFLNGEQTKRHRHVMCCSNNDHHCDNIIAAPKTQLHPQQIQHTLYITTIGTKKKAMLET
jgi:hypothetical protein